MIIANKKITDKIRESANKVVSNAKYISISDKAIDDFINNELKNYLKDYNYDNVENIISPKYHYIDLENPMKSIWYFFVLDTINFCFWNFNDRDKWTLVYKDGDKEELVSGYLALALVLKQEAKNNPLFDKPSYFAKLFKGELLRILYPLYSNPRYYKGELMLLEERVTNLRELGENILGKPLTKLYEKIFVSKEEIKNINEIRTYFKEDDESNKILNLFDKSLDVNKFLDNIIYNFKSYRDKGDYVLKDGQVIEVYFYKRAQLLAHDLYLLYKYYEKNAKDLLNKFPYLNLLNFKNISDLTVFADYKLPQLLEYKKIINYTEDLKNEIKQQIVISKEKEVEIRAATIVACQRIAKKINNINEALLDNILWNIAKNTNFNLPYHRSISIYY
ncbi:MAG: queuosine salvage family protein [bacterium]|jgi:hypothetical protein